MREPALSPVGHDQAKARLYGNLPQAALILGPESTGKWLLARHIADVNAPWYGQLELRCLTVKQAREVSRFLETFPAALHAKIVLADLDGAVSDAAQQALLKSLEEPPEYARFILTSSRPPLPTIASRCEIIRTGLLTDEQVARVLVSKGYGQKNAESVAPVGQGRVEPALAAVARFAPARVAVLGVVRAMAIRDKDLLERMVRDWGDTEDWMLRELLGAAASGKPTPLFSTMERQLIGKTAARRAIGLLAMSGQARPSARVRALAWAIMTERR